MPLVLAEADAPSTPLDKGKRVVEVVLKTKTLLGGKSSNVRELNVPTDSYLCYFFLAWG